MKLNEKTAKLIKDIEYLIGSQCYNPNSYDGWNNVEGCDFRYPICVPVDNEGNYFKTRFSLSDEEFIPITPENLKFMKYKFGSNELYIGLGIIDVLEYLENRYSLDFNELEKSLSPK